jgi:hypothetical protein
MVGNGTDLFGEEGIRNLWKVVKSANCEQDARKKKANNQGKYEAEDLCW